MKQYILNQIKEIRQRWDKTHNFSQANPMINEITGAIVNAPLVLPDIELVSAQVHEAWMESKKAQGIFTRKSEDQEELMVPYSRLSEKAKDLDRNTVKAVFAAIKEIDNK